MKFLRYLFPHIRNVDKLPLLPLKPWIEDTDKQQSEAIRLLLGNNVARTRQQARTILRHNQGVPVRDIIKQYKRRRNRMHRIKRAWERFKNIWRM